MAQSCHIDIETYSETNLIKSGVYRYAQDPSTKIWCIAFHFKDEMHLWKSWDRTTKAKLTLLSDIFMDPGVELVAHNAQFERVVLNACGLKLGLPSTEISQWRCTAVLAAMHALPHSLDGASKALGTSPKDGSTRSIMLALAKPRISGKLKGKAWMYKDRPEDFEKLAQYCVEDVLAEKDLARVLPRLPKSEQAYWEIDQEINDVGIAIDIDTVDLLLDLWPKKKARLDERCQELTGGIGVTQVKGLTEWLSLSDLTAGTIAKALDNPRLSKDKREVLELRDEARKTSITKFATLKRAVCKDNRLRGMFIFHGAQTGRWAGRIVQLHNLPQNTADDPEQLLARLRDDNMSMSANDAQSLIRPTFLGGADGLLIGDYKGIELRVSLWLTDDDVGLSKIRSNVDLYVDMAEFIYGPDVEIDGDKRFVGKQAVLGLGYGMGVPRFIDYCGQYGQTLESGLAKAAVDAYRDLYRSIVAAWNEVETAAIVAVRNPGKPVKCLGGRVKYVMRGRFLYCVLPSGRPIAYPDPMVINQETPWGAMKPALTYMSVNIYNKKWGRGSTFGGRLFENICQGIASCLLRNSMAEVRKRYTVVAHVHDELLAEGGAKHLPDFVGLMERVPPWGKGIPVEVEAVHSFRYLKG